MSIRTSERPASEPAVAAGPGVARTTLDRGGRPGGGSPAGRGEVHALTGLRLLAALWVVAFHFHFTPLAGVAVVSDWLGPLVTEGALGVDLFFVLSGFVIAWTYLEQLGPRLRARDAGEFVWARVARMWPAYAVVFHLFGVWLVARALFGSGDEIAYQAVQPELSVGAWLEQVFLVQMWTQPYLDGASWVGPTWSVSAEWLAYLLFPLLAVVFFRLRRLPAVVLAAGSLLCLTPIAAAFVVVGSPYYPYSWLVRILCGFSAGVLAMLAVRRMRETERVRAAASSTATVAAAAVPFVLLAGGVHGGGLHGLAVLLFPVLIGALALADRGPVHHLLTRPSVVHGGRISYALYLVHIPMFEIFWLLSDSGVLPAGGETGHLIALTVFVGTLPVAHLLYTLVEQPARRWMRGLPSRAAAAPARPTAAPAQVETAPPAYVDTEAARQDPVTSALPVAVTREHTAVDSSVDGCVRRPVTTDDARVDPETAVLPRIDDEPVPEALPVQAGRGPGGRTEPARDVVPAGADPVDAEPAPVGVAGAATAVPSPVASGWAPAGPVPAQQVPDGVVAAPHAPDGVVAAPHAPAEVQVVAENAAWPVVSGWAPDPSLVADPAPAGWFEPAAPVVAEAVPVAPIAPAPVPVAPVAAGPAPAAPVAGEPVRVAPVTARSVPDAPVVAEPVPVPAVPARTAPVVPGARPAPAVTEPRPTPAVTGAGPAAVVPVVTGSVPGGAAEPGRGGAAEPAPGGVAPAGPVAEPEPNPPASEPQPAEPEIVPVLPLPTSPVRTPRHVEEPAAPAAAETGLDIDLDGVPDDTTRRILRRLAVARAAGSGDRADQGLCADLVATALLRDRRFGDDVLVDGPGVSTGAHRIERLRELQVAARELAGEGDGRGGVVPAPRALRSAAALPGTRTGVEHCGRAARRRDDAHGSAATPIVAASAAAARRRRKRPAHGA
ncbi:acyltransferase family protein [Pseudonocardia nematodicida]|uniref:Acyltransferase family protein n=1 Tax=Pseudonocardia nematodicida TaxID=1206997 RepID=A0ABV1K9N5_9PSEU